MNLIADENVDKLIVDGLRQDGHNVLYVSAGNHKLLKLQIFYSILPIRFDV